MQPKIAYALHAILSLGPGADGCRTTLDERRGVRLMPFTTVSPPVQIDNLPAAPSAVSVRSLKQTLWTRPLGEMKISVDEPSPLNLCSETPRASTKCLIRLHLTPKCALTTTVRPECWGCIVESCLHIKTFYSVRPLPNLSDIYLVRLRSDLRVHSDFTKIESREANGLSWRLHRLSRFGTIIKDPQPSWIGIFTLPISTSKSLLPTFLSTFAARLYAIKIKAKISGVRHEPFELEVPLRVVYDSPTITHQLFRDREEGSLVSRRNSVPVPDILDPLVLLPEDLEVRCAYLIVCQVLLIASTDFCSTTASLQQQLIQV